MLAFHFAIIRIYKMLVYPCSGFRTPDTCVFSVTIIGAIYQHIRAQIY